MAENLISALNIGSVKYEIKDAFAREQLGNGVVHLSGDTLDTSAALIIPTDNSNSGLKLTSSEVQINNTHYTDTAISANGKELKFGTLSGTLAVTQDISNAINTLNVDDAAVEKQFVTEVDETNGKISVTRRALTEGDMPADYVHLTGDTMTGDLKTPNLSVGNAISVGDQLKINASGISSNSGSFEFNLANTEFKFKNGLTGGGEYTIATTDDITAETQPLSTNVGKISNDIYGTDGLSAQVLSNDKDIADLCAVVAGGVHYRGHTTADSLYDNSTVSSISITGPDGQTTTLNAQDGDIVIKDITDKASEEYIWGNGHWHKFGDVTEFGALAFADQVTGDYTPEGTVTNNAALTSLLTVDFSKAEFAGTEFVSSFALTGTSNVITPTFTGTSAELQPTWQTSPAQTYLNPTFTPSTSTFSNVIAVYAPALTSNTATLPINSGTTGMSITFTGSSTALTGTFQNANDVTLTGTTALETTTTDVTNASFTGSQATITATGTIQSTAFKLGAFNALTSVTTTPVSAITTATYDAEVLTFGFADVISTVTPNASSITPAMTENVGITATSTFTPAGTVSAQYEKLAKVVIPSASISGNIAGTFTPQGSLTGDYVVYEYMYSDSAKTTIPAQLETANVVYTYGGAVTLSNSIPTSLDSITYTPAGSISQVDATPSGDVQVKFTPAGTLTMAATVNASHTHTAEFSGTASTITGNPVTET